MKKMKKNFFRRHIELFDGVMPLCRLNDDKAYGQKRFGCNGEQRNDVDYEYARS